MKPEIFHFSTAIRRNWIVDVAKPLQRIKDFLAGEKNFEIEIRQVGKKRSGNQLRAYWVLINLITDYMNEQGNFFSPEEVSSWVKIQANHYHWVGGEKIARSIANKSDATVDDMKKIINFILDFGIEHNIRGCEISNAELDALLKFYEEADAKSSS